MGLAMALSVMVAEPATAADPQAVIQSITSCTVTLSPSTFGPTDVITMRAEFSGPDNYRVGADDLGAEWAAVSLQAGNMVEEQAVAANLVEGTYGLASGSHQMDFYAVDGSGVATGQPLCNARYHCAGSAPAPEVSIVRPSSTAPWFLPAAQQGLEYSASFGINVGDPRNQIQSCAVESVYYVPNSEVFGEMREMSLDQVGLRFVPGDLATTCGMLVGRPVVAGTFTVTTVGTFECPSTVVGSLAPAGVLEQTYATRSTFTLTVEPEASPTFTG